MSWRFPHLFGALNALIVLTGSLIGFDTYVRMVEQRYVDALAPQLATAEYVGQGLQRAAFQKGELLVVYGSSEMRGFNRRGDFSAYLFFQHYSTGFTVMDVSGAGVTSLNTLQSLAAIGPDLRGKKVVVSFTPSMFLAPEANSAFYAANFSRLRADEFVFSPSLSIALKQSVARRMLAYPTTLAQTPLLKHELENLGADTSVSRFAYWLAWPLGSLETWVLSLQDQAATIAYVWAHDRIKINPVHESVAIDWSGDINLAREQQIGYARQNPRRDLPDPWTPFPQTLNDAIQPASGDAKFTESLRTSQEWTDFDLMLRVLKELGARPLLLGRPWNGPLLNAMGVSDKAQAVYYDKMEAEAETHRFPLVDFRNETGDAYFSVDQFSHPSNEGWVYVDEALDAFYHDRLR